MYKKIRGLGTKEAEFLSIVAEGGGQFVLAAAIEFWGSAAVASRRLYQLRKKNWVALLERGKYMVIPLEAGAEREWPGDPYVVGSSLVNPSAIAYSTALRHWGWIESGREPVYIQTTSRKNTAGKSIRGVRYEVVRVPQAKFYGHITVARGGNDVIVTDREKSLIDCADDVERGGGINELINAVRASAGVISWPVLGEYGVRFPNRSALKRLGFLIESELSELPDEARLVLDRWRSHMSKGVVPLQPGPAGGGRISTRWRVRVNVWRETRTLPPRGI